MSVAKFTQYASKKDPLDFEPVTKEIESLGPHEVLLKILACGVCYGDCYFSSEGGIMGHEPVGRVTSLGSEVKKFEIGDIVGTTFVKSACMDCDRCISGNDTACHSRVIFPAGNNNGFAEYQLADSRYTFKIPEGIEPKYAAPLMCAGLTVFNAIYNSNVRPTDHIGVLGIGGLGHLALQFARAWGCHVTALSNSPDKEEEAKSFGAHDFIVTKGLTAEGAKDIKKFDLILVTASVDIDTDLYIDLLNDKGTLYCIGVPPNPMVVKQPIMLLVGQKSIKGSVVGGRYMMSKMLEFVQRHNIKSLVEEYPFDLQGLKDSMKRCSEGKARYRGVLIAE